MKRVQQHIIEEESRKSFAQLIPDGWVTNDFTKDYGKDIHLEIFRQNESTGNMFIAQLKGSSKKIIADTLCIQISTNSLKYYEDIDTPVLLVFYSTETKFFWAIWANGLYRLLKVKEKQKNVSVKLTKKHIIDKVFFEKLQLSFNNQIPFRVNIQTVSEGVLAELFIKRILAWCNFYFPESLEIDNSVIPSKLVINVTDDGEKLNISCRDNEREYSLSSINKSMPLSFLLKPLIIENEIDDKECEILYFLTSFFCKFSPQNVFKILHEIFHRYTGYLKNNKSVQIIAKFAIENNLIHELQRLIEISIIQNQFNDFQFLNSEFVNKKKFHEYYRKNLTQGIAKFDSPRGKGMLCYNLANHYRHLGDDLYSSFSYYIKAKRYEPNYLTKYYWWHEIAGVLFLSNHFAFAEKFYRKSIELDKSQVCIPFTYCLLADCLFQNTKFSEASKFYEQYFDEVLGMNKKIMLYFGFKQSLCNTMIEKGYENTVIQNRESVNIFHKAREKNSEELYYKSIELHPLMYLAWNDLGSMYFSQRKFNEAFDAFFIAALIIQTDEDIWMDCLLSAIFTISDELAESIFLVMVQLFGVEILNKITIMVNERLRFSITDTIATLKLFSAMADSFKKFSRDIYMPPAEEYRIYL